MIYGTIISVLVAQTVAILHFIVGRFLLKDCLHEIARHYRYYIALNKAVQHEVIEIRQSLFRVLK